MSTRTGSLREFSACTAVSQIWHDLGYPFLFRHIELLSTCNDKSSARKRTYRQTRMLVEFADAAPILSYVRTLSIDASCICAPSFPRLITLLETQRRDIVLLQNDAAPPRWRDVKRLWNALGEEKRTALYKLLQFPTAIAVTKGSLPRAAWGPSGSLKSLDLIQRETVYLDPIEDAYPHRRYDGILQAFLDPSEDIHRKYPSLTHLALWSSLIPQVLRDNPKAFQKLKSVRLAVQDKETEAMRSMFLASRNIRSAWISNTCYIWDDATPLIFSEYSGRELHIEFRNTIPRINTKYLRATFASLPLHTLSDLSFDACLGSTTDPFDLHQDFWPHIITSFLRELDNLFAPYSQNQATSNGGAPTRPLAVRRLRVAFSGGGCVDVSRPSAAGATCYFGRGVNIETPQGEPPLLASISNLVESGMLDYEAVIYGPMGRRYPMSVDRPGEEDASIGNARMSCGCKGPRVTNEDRAMNWQDQYEQYCMEQASLGNTISDIDHPNPYANTVV